MSMSAPHTVIVTGAAGGIGYNVVCELLKKHGACVVATDIVEGSLGGLKEEYKDKLRVVVGDIVDPSISQQCVELAVKTFGQLTGLALIAGVFGPCHRLENSSLDKWSKAMSINVLSHLNTLRYAIPQLRETKGTVVAATSGAGLGPLFSGWGFYGMSKAAVAFNIRQLSMEEKDITAIGISPGMCDTKMVQDLRAGKQEGWTAQDIQDYEKFVARIPMVLPETTATSYASALVHRTPELSGVIVDYDDPRLPIEESLKNKSTQNPTNYTEFSPQAK